MSGPGTGLVSEWHFSQENVIAQNPMPVKTFTNLLYINSGKKKCQVKGKEQCKNKTCLSSSVRISLVSLMPD